jgi:hypothetical protein
MPWSFYFYTQESFFLRIQLKVLQEIVAGNNITTQLDGEKHNVLFIFRHCSMQLLGEFFIVYTKKKYSWAQK